MFDYSPVDPDHIRIYGRTVRRTPLPLFWTASGIEFDTDAREAWIEIECDYSGREYYLRVEIDGYLIQRFLIPRGRQEYCLFRELPEGELKTVTVRMETQPMGDDEIRKLLIHRISTDRILQVLTPKTHRIEFIGDSLTSGEGLTGSPNMQDWCAGIFGLTGHYGLQVASHFDAEYSIVSQSGWGVCSAWDNNTCNIIPPYYTQICGVADNETTRGLGACDDWDFSSWQPELVVVNLGTNDGGAFTNPAWTDPETGITHKMQTGADGNPDHDSAERFGQAVYDFLKKIRSCNPDAYILWVYGMCGPYMAPYIRDAVDRYVAEAGDARASFLLLPECSEDEQGSHTHPGIPNHTASARLIIDTVEELGILE